jgi:dihydroorotate dehydrogenase electron transfer subunit
MNNKVNRDTIALETATIVALDAHDGDQFVMRLFAPECAGNAMPGQFTHIQCDPLLAMRRPLSIMRANPSQGWVDLLFKAVGRGTRLLSQRKIGEQISVLGPIGIPFKHTPTRPRALLLGGGVGMPPMIFLAEHLKQLELCRPLVLLGSEVPFPFAARPSQIMLPGIPNGTIGAMPLLEDWGIPSRLASLQAYPGCYEGYITDLARYWLKTLDQQQLGEVEIFACGPHPMLQATARLAREYDLPCQVSLEEYMACAVGGCAGCVVQVKRDENTLMKRVCVDGPVFDAYSIFL